MSASSRVRGLRPSPLHGSMRAMGEIYHMIRAETWVAVQGEAEYRDDSLAHEGFIHCTAGERNLVDVAARHYAGDRGDWLVLVLDPAKLRSEVRWELQPDALAYPHIYGPLNLDAVTAVCRFPRNPEGVFQPFRDLVV